MSLIIYLFEDHTYSNFHPLTYNRPVCELLFGINKIREKVAWHFPEAEIRLLCRDYLKVLLEQKTGLKVNYVSDSRGDRAIFLNGRVIPDQALRNKIDLTKQKSYWQNDILLASVSFENAIKKQAQRFLLGLKLKPDTSTEIIDTGLPSEKIECQTVSYLWDLVSGNPSQIAVDFQDLKPRLADKQMSGHSSVDQQAVIYNPSKVYLGKNSRLEAFVVLNAENGPIYVDDDCQIQAFTRIEGPVYIGKNSHLYSAHISGGCSFGPECRLGGEIQQSIFQGYSNKYHEGFLGHSYLGEWVNLGAGTFNSDLKNNYSEIKVTFPDKGVETGQNKIGSFIGDHAKTGIGTLLNTGSYLGLGCNIFGGGMIRAKFIPSFGWGNLEGLQEYSWDKFIQTASAVMQRRAVELSDPEKEVLEKIFALTKPEREVFFQS